MPQRGARGVRGGKGKQDIQNLPKPKCVPEFRLSGSTLQNLFDKLSPNFTQCQDTISIFQEILPVKLRGKSCTIDSEYTPIQWTSTSNSSGRGILKVRKGLEEQEVSAYQKKIPLIDPYYWIKCKERPDKPFFWDFQSGDIKEPENQGYVDILASSLVHKLGTLYNSPHFCKFYGCFRAVVGTYLFDLEEELEEMRFTKWFWQAVESNDIGLRIVEKSSGRVLTLQEIKEVLKPDDDFLQEDSDDEDEDEDEDGDEGTNDKKNSKIPPKFVKKEILDSEYISDNESELSAESLSSEVPTPYQNSLELEEASLDSKSVDSTPVILQSKEQDESLSSLSSNESFFDDYSAHAELYEMPVVVMFSEAVEGTMDDLVTNPEYSPANTPEKEKIWAAWLFQVIAALQQIQGGLNLTHNDLHTNNVLFKKTDIEYLWYKDSMGRTWKIPTYGYLFYIIDFGRAIFYLNQFVCIGSDYDEGQNAHGQYNFGPLYEPELPKVLPNKHFDLSRLACSLLRGLYPHNPEALSNGKIISKENTWEVKETIHPLFNSLWTWLIDSDGHNVLETESGDEKYPGFDLYIVIAHKIRNALPKDQFMTPLLKSFMTKEIAPTGIKYIHIPL